MALIVVVPLFLSTRSSYAATASGILRNVREAASFKTVAMRIDMVLTDSIGQRRDRSFEWYAVDTDGVHKRLIVIDAPDTIKGTKYLLITRGRSTTQYVYMPSMHKVRRIGVAELRESFLGSDLSYDDLKNSSYLSWHNTLLKGDVCPEEKVRCFVVQSLPPTKDGGPPPYSKIVQWIRSKDYVPVYAEFYRGRDVAKTLRVQEIKSIEGRSIATRTYIHNPVTGHSTLVTIRHVLIDRPIDGSLFTVRFLGQP